MTLTLPTRPEAADAARATPKSAPERTSPLVVAASLDPFDRLAWSNRFAALPAAFGTRLEPVPLPDPYLVALSEPSAALLGEPAAFAQPEAIAVMAGNRVPAAAEPMAAVYSGHQFGVWAGQLGDGRAHLLGGVETRDGLLELQLKGAGSTPYSRMGDGRAVLRSSIREFLCSEAMHGLGIATTRALSIVGSDQPVIRETVETAAVVLRMAPSFVRFGSFEHWSSRNRFDELKVLADYVIDSFYPQIRDGTGANPYQALLAAVTERTARLMAQWQAVGFCHGVMNTDNMSILGLTLDYGPFGFLDGFDANHICNHTDQQGRYSYANQPAVARWNLYCLAEALMPLIDDVDSAEAALEPFKATFGHALDSALHAKLGLAERRDDDQELIDGLFTVMQGARVDFTLLFRRLGGLDRVDLAPGREARDLFLDREPFDRWLVDYRARLLQESRDADLRRVEMQAVNPKFVLRNHLAEAAIVAARDKDYTEVERLATVLRRPFDEQPASERYADLPPAWASTLEVSCSS